MAEAVLPLDKINVPPHKAYIKGELKKISALMKIGDALTSGVPGIPDVGAIIQKEIEKRVDKEIQKAIKIVMAFIAEIMLGVFADNIPKLNAVIKKLNALVAVINGLLDFLKGLLTPIFAFYIVVTVVYIVAKIFTLIPSFGGGMGAVVVVTAPGNIAGAIQSAAGNVHAKIKDVPVAIIAIYDKLLAIFNLLDALVNLAAAFGAMQTTLAQDASAASNKTAESIK